MSATQDITLWNGMKWSVGYNVVSIADVIIPIETLVQFSDDEIAKYVRALSMNALRLMATEIVREWEGYQKHAPDAQLYHYASLLRDHTYDGVISQAHSLIVAQIGRRSRTKVKKKEAGAGGYVYLAYCDTGHYKIGYSAEPEGRIRHFDTQMPVSVDLIHAIETDDMRALESMLHERFADKRINGEWFELTEDEVAWIKNLDGHTDGLLEELPY